MAVLALVLIGVWLLLVAVVRTVLHTIRTGSAEVLSFRDRRGSAEQWSGLLGAVGFLLAVAAPVAELLGWGPVPVLDRTGLRAFGAAIMVVGIAASFAAQLAMGDSWRADVDPEVRTRLITTGPFRLVRNPIFTATGMTFIGMALLVPHPLAPFMLAATLGSLEIQVRLAEEPYLHRVHGTEWEAYAARTGRFLPYLGRHRSGPPGRLARGR